MDREYGYFLIMSKVWQLATPIKQEVVNSYPDINPVVLQLLYKLSILNVFEFFNELILLSLLINRSNNKNKNNSKTNSINKINILLKKIKIRIVLIFIHISVIRLFQIFDDISLSYIFLYVLSF